MRLEHCCCWVLTFSLPVKGDNESSLARTAVPFLLHIVHMNEFICTPHTKEFFKIYLHLFFWFSHKHLRIWQCPHSFRTSVLWKIDRRYVVDGVYKMWTYWIFHVSTHRMAHYSHPDFGCTVVSLLNLVRRHFLLQETVWLPETPPWKQNTRSWKNVQFQFHLHFHLYREISDYKLIIIEMWGSCSSEDVDVVGL